MFNSPAPDPDPRPEADLSFQRCSDAIEALERADSNIDEPQLFNLFNELRLSAESLCFKYDVYKILHGASVIPLYAAQMEQVIDKAILTLRENSTRCIEPGGTNFGIRDFEPLDLYQMNAEWISSLTEKRATFRELNDQWDLRD